MTVTTSMAQCKGPYAVKVGAAVGRSTSATLGAGPGSAREIALRVTTVAVEQLAIDPLTLIRQQEPHQVGHVGRRPEASAGLHRDSAGPGLVVHPTRVDRARIDHICP